MANVPLIKHNLVPLSFDDVEKDAYASPQIKKQIPEEHQTHVEKNLREDIENLSSSTIAGLSITLDQLNQ